MSIKFFITTLAQDLELEEIPQRSKEGVFALTLNEEFSFLVRETEERVILEAQVAPLPQEKQEEVALMLMSANFLGQKTGSCALGLERNEKFLTLSCILPYDMDYKLFKLSVEEFVNYLSFWKEEIRALNEKD